MLNIACLLSGKSSAHDCYPTDKPSVSAVLFGFHGINLLKNLVSRELLRNLENFHFSISISKHFDFTFYFLRKSESILISLGTSRKRVKAFFFTLHFSKKSESFLFLLFTSRTSKTHSRWSLPLWFVKFPVRFRVLVHKYMDGEVGPDLGRGQWRKIVWRPPCKKICPKYMILRTSGVIWVHSGVIWVHSGVFWGYSGVILECRITVCNYSVAPSIQKSQLSTLISCIYTRTLQCISHVLSPDRSTSFTSLLNSDWKNMPICSLCFNNLPFTCTFISVLPERDTKREDILKQIWNVGNKILRPSNNKHITAPAKSGHHTTFIISKSKVQIWAHWPPFFGLFACFQRYLERCFYSAGQTHYYQNQI